MGTTTGALNRVTIFDPVIKINGVDVGFVSDKISLHYQYTSGEYASGIPKNLRKSIKTEEMFMCKFDLMQSSLGNFQSAMNLPAGSLVSTSLITVGGDSQMSLLTNFEFVGTDDAGKVWRVVFYKAYITESSEWNIDADYVKIGVTVKAVADLSRTRGDQLAFLNREA